MWPKIKNGETISKPEWSNQFDEVTFMIAWEQMEKYLVHNKDRISLLKKLEENGVNLLFCTDVQVRNALVDIEQKLIEQKKEKNMLYGIKYKNTKNKCSRIRSAFKVIGREHAWIDGEHFTNLGKPLINSGNPMTLAVQQHLENATKKRKKEVEVNIMGERPNGLRLKDNLDQREGSAANVGVAYFALMVCLLQTIKWCLSPSIKKIDRVHNMASLCLILAFVFHEGSRPKEIFKHGFHNRLYFPISTRECDKVYWLTLVFCKIDTLDYILRKNLLSRYVISLWKGKNAQQFRNRTKSLIPFPYNSLDLVTIYVIVLRLLFHKNPDLLSQKIISKEKKNWSSGMRNLLNKFMIFGFTFYSIRYSAAEEDVKYGIDPDDTRKRMGHSDVSHVYKQYAENLMARAAMDGKPLVLASDIIKNNPNELVPLEFCPLTGSLKVRKNFEDCIVDKNARLDFCETAKLVADYLDKNDTVAYDELRKRATNGSSKDKDKELAKIPFGFNFDFPSELMPSKLRDSLQDIRGELATYLDTRSNENTKILLWSYTQIMYGEWSNINGKDKIKINKILDKIVEEDEREDDGDGCDSDSDDEGVESEDSLDFEDIADIVDEIGVDNYICVYAEKKDRDSMVIPSINKWVWLIQVTEIGKKKIRLNNGQVGVVVHGYKFMNKDQDLTRPFEKTKTIIRIIVTDDCLLKIYSDLYDGAGNIDFGKSDVAKLERIFSGAAWVKNR